MTENFGFYKKVYLSFKGMLFYKKLLSKNRINKNTFLLIQGSNDKEIIHYGNIYMSKFIEKNKLEKIIILTSDEYSEKLMNDKPQVKKIDCPVKKINCLICLYCMYQFSRNLLIFGVDRPNTNKLLNLIKTGILTKEEAVAIGIYGLNSIKE